MIYLFMVIQFCFLLFKNFYKIHPTNTANLKHNCFFCFLFLRQTFSRRRCKFCFRIWKVFCFKKTFLVSMFFWFTSLWNSLKFDKTVFCLASYIWSNLEKVRKLFYFFQLKYPFWDGRNPKCFVVLKNLLCTIWNLVTNFRKYLWQN